MARTVTGKDTPPASTLHSRPKEVRPDNFPAPGDYNPEKAEKVIHEHSPQYTFGLKTQVEKPNPNPAPNVYNIPTVMGAAKEGHFKAAPSFSISGRTKEFPDGRLLNPGPGAYNDVSADSIKPKSPAYTVSARYNMPGDNSPRPGPGAYSPEKVSRDAHIRKYRLMHNCRARRCIVLSQYSCTVTSVFYII